MDNNIKLLKDTKKILDKYDIDYFPVYGTLLGFVREKRIMPWDNDLDFGVWYEDYDKFSFVISEFKSKGYDKIKIRDFIISVYCPNDNFHVDFYFWIKDEECALEMGLYKGKILSNILHILKGFIERRDLSNYLLVLIKYILIFTCKKKVMPYKEFKHKESLNVYGMKFNIPSNYLEYLELVYGKDWRTPKKIYSWKTWFSNNNSIIKYQIKGKNVKKILAGQFKKHI